MLGSLLAIYYINTPLIKMATPTIQEAALAVLNTAKTILEPEAMQSQAAIVVGAAVIHLTHHQHMFVPRLISTSSRTKQCCCRILTYF